MAVEEVNAAGGVLGKKIEIVSRDDNGQSGRRRARRRGTAEPRESRLPGRHLPVQRRPRVADFASSARRYSSPPSLDRQDRLGCRNAYTFRLRTSTYMQTAMLIPDAAKLKKKRWAIVYPNYEYGTSATAASRSS